MILKKTFKSLVVSTVLLCSVVPFPMASAEAQDIPNEYESSVYQVTPKDNVWSSFSSKEEMVEATHLSDERLKEMSTDELIDAVMDYPLLVNLYLHNSYEDGLQELAKDSDAYKELLTRPDASESLVKRLSEQNNQDGVISSQSTENMDSLESRTLSLLIAEDTVWNKIDDKGSVQEMIAPYASVSTVKTPNGSSVSVIINGEQFSSLEKAQLDFSTANSYPNATKVSSSTTNYNCHSYAWYSIATNNKYWMNNPGAYMSDGSYRGVNVISAVSGTKMNYPYGDHSAIVYAAGGPLASPSYLQVTSKWGQGPVMRHQAGYSPYNSSSLTLWNR